jgi:hypothetical protein
MAGWFGWCGGRIDEVGILHHRVVAFSGEGPATKAGVELGELKDRGSTEYDGTTAIWLQLLR